MQTELVSLIFIGEEISP